MRIKNFLSVFAVSISLIIVSCVKSEPDYGPNNQNFDQISVLKVPDLDEHEWLAYTLHDKTDFKIPSMHIEAMIRNFANSDASTYSSGETIRITNIKSLNPVTYSDTEHTGAYLVEFTTGNKEGYSLCSSDMRFDQIFAFVPEGFISDTMDNKALAGFIGNIDYIMHDSIERYNALAEVRYQSALEKIKAQKIEAEEEAEYKKRHTYFIIDEVTGAELDENDGWHPYSNPNNIFDFRRCELSHSDYSDSQIYEQTVPLNVKWNQTPPYNNLMPLAEEGQFKYSNGRVAAGCVTIAVAQIMTYYRKGYNTDQWDAMTANKNLSYCSSAGIDAATRMIRYVYDGVGATPKPNGTGAYTVSARNFLTDNGFGNSGVVSPDIDRLYSNASAKRLAYAGGVNVSTKTRHSWVIDGVKKYRRTSRDYYDCEQYGGGGYYLKESPYPKSTLHKYVKCNWGWGGSSDGWFNYDTFVKTGENGYKLDEIICDLY